MIRLNETASGAGEEGSSPPLAPMVDVLFLLLVFLMLTANAAPLAAGIATPHSDIARAMTADPAVLEVQEAGWRFEAQRLEDDGALRAALTTVRANDPERPLVIAIDAAAPAQRLLDALDIASSAGFEGAEISVRRR
ncbi:biopolymer transport protein ExbD1 [Glycocaulis alkaliphilus]|uniref:Biopolymer transport protein ExbD1 n=1 Tax=Glycocaulis alkaliphilus TaxID=1434191 RepID=A0A3T0EBR6_9PROT|nr:biopolymer transporter ExbD [Glycocaulis alkaliphilus]AZU04428.1 biopolymer transport protein ExbD1 [Glycocaulis alkaliphilus]GGB78304.1 hypothetical protein GCM10007417_17780 [Glycocaulis alkaliphilus]